MLAVPISSYPETPQRRMLPVYAVAMGQAESGGSLDGRIAAPGRAALDVSDKPKAEQVLSFPRSASARASTDLQLTAYDTVEFRERIVEE